jgi:uroporphyrinogen-III synthase
VTGPALDGAGVLVTRPAQLAGGMIAAIEGAGGIAVPFPVIDIVPRDASDIQKDAEHLPAADVVIFVSQNAVAYGLPAVIRQATCIAAIGPATRAAVEAAGYEVDVVSDSGFDSEHLLATSVLRQVAGKRICIVRGDDGRETLARTLRSRGATVDYLSVYRRVPHHFSAAELKSVSARWRSGQVQFAVAMSVASLNNLLSLLPGDCREAFAATRLVTPSRRVIQTALERIPQVSTVLAAGPDSGQMVAAMVASLAPQTDDTHD